jgi:predicted nucleic acid-binding protein
VKRSVIDASYAGAWILPDELSEQAEEILQQTVSGELQLIVPALWHYEMSNLIAVAQRRKRITVQQAEKAIEILSQIPIETFDHQSLVSKQRIQRLVVQHKLSAYDAAYLELADRLNLPLLTNDKALADASQTC